MKHSFWAEEAKQCLEIAEKVDSWGFGNLLTGKMMNMLNVVTDLGSIKESAKRLEVSGSYLRMTLDLVIGDCRRAQTSEGYAILVSFFRSRLPKSLLAVKRGLAPFDDKRALRNSIDEYLSNRRQQHNGVGDKTLELLIELQGSLQQ